MNAIRGYHAMVDGAADPPAVDSWSEELVDGFLRETVSMARMTLVSGPVVQKTERGYVGIAVLAESHVSAHLDVLAGSVHADLFSCKGFDAIEFAWRCIEAFRLREHRLGIARRSLGETP